MSLLFQSAICSIITGKMALALFSWKTLVLALGFAVTARQRYSYAAVIITTVCEQNSKREIMRITTFLYSHSTE